MAEELPEHVRDFKWETRFSRKGQVVHFVHDHNASALSPKVKEYWTVEKASIGRGGQGLVALQACVSGPRRGDRRAVKKIALQDREAKRRYIAELKTNIKFSHDRYSNHFVKTLGWYESSDYLYIAMVYFPAGDLHAYLKEHRLAEDEARQITAQILRGLALMHEENYAHRDIKPQNVLIQEHPGQGDHSGTWWVKLADFGISKKMGATADFGSTTVIGTEAYMAPELFSESRHPSAGFPAADMWALGIMAYFMLTGEVAFTGRRSLFRYEEQPDTLFPRQTLVSGGVTSNGQQFIRELLHPRARDRPDCAAASHLPWMRDWLASDLVVSDSASECSFPSLYSDESLRGDERGLTTQVSVGTTQRIESQMSPMETSSSPTPERDAAKPVTRRPSYGDDKAPEATASLSTAVAPTVSQPMMRGEKSLFPSYAIQRTEMSQELPPNIGFSDEEWLAVLEQLRAPSSSSSTPSLPNASARQSPELGIPTQGEPDHLLIHHLPSTVGRTGDPVMPTSEQATVFEGDIFHREQKPWQDFEAARPSTVLKGVGQLQDIDENQNHEQYYYGQWQSVSEPSKEQVPYESRIPLRKPVNTFSDAVNSPLMPPQTSVSDQDLVEVHSQEPHLQRGSPSNGIFYDEAPGRYHSTPSFKVVRPYQPYQPTSEVQISEVRPMRETVSNDSLAQRSRHSEAAAAAGGGGDVGNLDFLRTNPQFHQLRLMVHQRPQLLEPILHQLGAVNPQLAQLIASNREQFLQLLGEEDDDTSKRAREADYEWGVVEGFRDEGEGDGGPGSSPASSPPSPIDEVARSQPAGSKGAAERLMDFFRRRSKAYRLDEGAVAVSVPVSEYRMRRHYSR